MQAFEESSIQTAEDSRNPLYVQYVQHLVNRPTGPSGAESLVGELGKGRPVVRALHHPLQLSLLLPLGRSLKGQCQFLEAPR